jgi:hypothetical protein
MVSRRFLATILIAGAAVIGGPAARATTVNFVGHDDGSAYASGSVDVQGSFSYTSTNNPLGYADLTAFTISFPNAGPAYTFGTAFVTTNAADPSTYSYFQFDPTKDMPIQSGISIMTSGVASSGNYFQIDYFSNSWYWTTMNPASAANSPYSGNMTDLTFTVLSSPVTTPEPSGIAVLAVATAGLAVAYRRGHRRRRPAA